MKLKQPTSTSGALPKIGQNDTAVCMQHGRTGAEKKRESKPEGEAAAAGRDVKFYGPVRRPLGATGFLQLGTLMGHIRFSGLLCCGVE